MTTTGTVQFRAEPRLLRWWRSRRRDYGSGMTWPEWEAYKAQVVADVKANWPEEATS